MAASAVREAPPAPDARPGRLNHGRTTWRTTTHGGTTQSAPTQGAPTQSGSTESGTTQGGTAQSASTQSAAPWRQRIWGRGTWGRTTWRTAAWPAGTWRKDQGRHNPLRTELLAQQIIGDQLDRLEGVGWRVLHSIPLPGADARIDHLAIGPAGVLAVRTLAAHGQRVRIADPMVRTGRSAPLPQLRWARRAAERASYALATAVRPVLAVVDASEPSFRTGRTGTLPSPPDVRILRDTEIPSLASLGGVLKPADIETLYATARDRHTWLSV
ncbi:NERD domain-containing protein [Streptomyces sp. GMY02]|uniref:nuclease-related domain-containing protein n=1 Tax=Streptomyces sp. GMY02 TaxID=1333528 RepID=UPI001C2C2F1A|nr:nuclease-related domain-containing protein [Streptomyces sp. GMY02]QXE39042.1 NERD domain-containing protein [Streptomyces sp. GMY02]